jgi:succinyl-diaminopimelate desuccinylase
MGTTTWCRLRAPGSSIPSSATGVSTGGARADMKSGLAAMIYATPCAGARRSSAARPHSSGARADEETGGAHGSAHLLERGILGTERSGMLTRSPRAAWHGTPAADAVSLRLTATRASPHTLGLQHEGVNAFRAHAADRPRLVRVRAHDPFARHASPSPPGRRRRSILLVGGRVEAGSNFNAVARRVCTLTVDRRMNPEEDLRARAPSSPRSHGARSSQGRALRDRDASGESSSGHAQRRSPGPRASNQRPRVTGHAPRFELCPGLLEIRFYAQCSVPALRLWPRATRGLCTARTSSWSSTRSSAAPACTR